MYLFQDLDRSLKEVIIIRFKTSIPQNFGTWFQDSCALIQGGGDRGPALVLLNVLNERRKVIKYETCRTFYRFFSESLMYPI